MDKNIGTQGFDAAKLAAVPGVSTFLQSIQNIQVGGRLARTQYQYTLQDTNLDELDQWAPKMLAKPRKYSALFPVPTTSELGILFDLIKS